MSKPRSAATNTSVSYLHSNPEDAQSSTTIHKSRLTGDYQNLALLLFLYTLQGIPMGLSASIPIVLSEAGASYADQGMFSLVTMPFSLKLLWAPIVDSIWIKSMGRRKCWLVPVQFLCGAVMIWLGTRITDFIEKPIPDVWALTQAFLVLYFLMATQDIAVDGWALTILKEKNRPLASTVNSIGQSLGYFLAYIVFLAFSNKEFCNNWLRRIPKEEGMITLSGFLWFFGWTFIFSTVILIFLKREEEDEEEASQKSPIAVYRECIKVLTLPNIKQLIIILLTGKVGWTCVETTSSFKLIELGIPKGDLAFLGVALMPLSLFIPLTVVSCTRREPLDFWLKLHLPRLVLSVIGYAALGSLTSSPWLADGAYFYALILIATGCVTLVSGGQFVAIMSFFNTISDPNIGGTYMTLLNTVNNLAGSLAKTLSLYCLSLLSEKSCSIGGEDCNSMDGLANCKEMKGDCVSVKDGFWILSPLCFVLGLIWYIVFYKKVRALSTKKRGWRVEKKKA